MAFVEIASIKRLGVSASRQRADGEIGRSK
jgi:hypothetical protein